MSYENIQTRVDPEKYMQPFEEWMGIKCGDAESLAIGFECPDTQMHRRVAE